MLSDIAKGLKQLGFDSGWVLQGNEIILWENSEPIPSMNDILEAAPNYQEPEPTIEQKLASVGLSVDELKEALGL